MASKDWIRDPLRDSYMRAAYNRIARGRSCLIVGPYGSGKSTLLSQLQPRKRRLVYAESLAPLGEMLGGMLRQLDYTVQGVRLSHRKWQYLEQIMGQAANIAVVMDEANDLDRKGWPWIKRMMNADVPMVMAGLPTLETFLLDTHPDVLSRFKVLRLPPVGAEAYKKFFPNVAPEAVDLIYGASDGNMRRFQEILDDCLDKLRELESDRVTLAIAEEFVD